MDDGAIRLERRGARGRYVLDLADGDAAELTFVEQMPGERIADHSWVPPRQRGRGLALRLVVRLVEDARRDGVSIVPLCRYVAVEFRRHPEWADVLRA